jgi:hypothetical protein
MVKGKSLGVVLVEYTDNEDYLKRMKLGSTERVLDVRD